MQRSLVGDNAVRSCNAELATNFQMFKGRVVLRGDIAKDDSGVYAVFY